MKKTSLLLLVSVLVLLAACKRETFDANPESQELANAPKSITTDYSKGVRTIEYKDGRKQVITLAADTSTTKTVRLSKTISKIQLTDRIPSPLDFPNQFTGRSAKPEASWAVPVRVDCGAYKEEDQQARFIVNVFGYYANVEPAYTEYKDVYGRKIIQKASVFGVRGKAAPLPGVQVYVTWYYTINYTFITATGTFTEQEEGSSSQIFYYGGTDS
ncbi:MAG TPA: hypothetical protein VM802_19075 [Chitinophaga sp.]|uniref:hypothetical protein n=1 Tax=Chitinophaga sp. TaxID=1869181 RepID=UPI002B963900|nr:hypothetical protein [Chitinophaga sp.]HVI46990.1 hypothetical protein [Chitinophaga sp.]